MTTEQIIAILMMGAAVVIVASGKGLKGAAEAILALIHSISDMNTELNNARIEREKWQKERFDLCTTIEDLKKQNISLSGQILALQGEIQALRETIGDTVKFEVVTNNGANKERQEIT
jgi:chromosome segregation ATPase